LKILTYLPFAKSNIQAIGCLYELVSEYILMKIHSILIICICILLSCKNESNVNSESNNIILSDTNDLNWLDFKFDSVIAFATVDPFLMIPQSHNKIDLSNIKDTISITLSKNQISILDSVVNGKCKVIGKEILPADCFNPRHNIVFFDGDSIVNFISVCYECGYYRASKNNIKGGLESFKYFFNGLGLKVFDRPDFHSKYYDSVLAHRKYIR
jgi:hypothetical protein